ncbi:hypothetical protein DPEC_G00174880 [Dallia pectoralis]|uniref:Uncharacterized protein n=1 Tax=Dallia pectoralis TaxID=75939 RepID=A0ACC2GE16_DALPE|nr:hypothetical protein DPEC_G00174880 [Dallia pectoralis]
MNSSSPPPEHIYDWPLPEHIDDLFPSPEHVEAKAAAPPAAVEQWSAPLSKQAEPPPALEPRLWNHPQGWFMMVGVQCCLVFEELACLGSATTLLQLRRRNSVILCYEKPFAT